MSESTRGQEELTDELRELLATEDHDSLRAAYEETQPADFADAVEALDEGDIANLLEVLGADDAAEVMEEMESEAQTSAAESLAPELLADVLEEMAGDEAADLLGQLEPGHARQLLDLMEAEDSAEVEQLLVYEPDSAGGLMAPEVVTVPPTLTADQTISRLRELHLEAETQYYMYVVDHDDKAVGAVSLRQLLAAQGDTPVIDLMITPLIAVRTGDDQEKVARTMQRYDFLALPVLDEEGRLRGVVTADDVMDVIEEELGEDLLRFAGTSQSTDGPRAPAVAAWYRLPVVLICLFGDVWAGHAVLKYEEGLTELASLAAFLPAMMATGGNIGQQSLATVIRAIASGERATPTIVRAVATESAVGLVMGVCSGVVLGLTAWFWLHRWVLGLILVAALSITSVVAAMLGAGVPLLLCRLGRDPANASGPLITTLNDIISTTVYFALAVTMLRVLG